MYVHFHYMTEGWQCLLTTLTVPTELLAPLCFHTTVPTNHFLTYTVESYLHGRVTLNSSLVSLGLIDLLKN